MICTTSFAPSLSSWPDHPSNCGGAATLIGPSVRVSEEQMNFLSIPWTRIIPGQLRTLLSLAFIVFKIIALLCLSVSRELLKSHTSTMGSAGEPEIGFLDALIIGTGFGGFTVLNKLRKLGLNVRIYEKGSSAGGVWYVRTTLKRSPALCTDHRTT